MQTLTPFPLKSGHIRFLFQKQFFDNFAQLLWSKYLEDSQNFQYHTSKTEDRKNRFTFVSEHCTTFRTRILIWPLLRGKGGGGLQVVNKEKPLQLLFKLNQTHFGL